MGNTMVAEWKGCPDEAMKKLGVTRLPPVITSVAVPNNDATTAGSFTLRIVGANFGLGGSAAPVTVTVGGSACISPLVSIPHTTILCGAPPGAGVNQPVVVTLFGQSSASFPFSYPPPTINTFNGIQPTSGPTAGGITLTIQGTNFSANPTVTVGGVACTNPVAGPQHIQMTCTVPAGSGANKTVIVNAAGQTALALANFNYLAPTITNIAPAFGPATGGTALTITGANFGAGGASATIGGVACPGGTTVAHTTFVCAVPAGTAGVAAAVQIAVGNQLSNTSLFTYQATSCSAGQFLSGGTCTPCSPGSFSPGGPATSCSACAAGFIAPGSGSASCSACPAGQFQPQTGGTACLPCAAGYTSTRHEERRHLRHGRRRVRAARGDVALVCGPRFDLQSCAPMRSIRSSEIPKS